MKKILFIDIDGTIMPAAAMKIKSKIVERIKELKKHGHIFVIATGRGYNQTFNIDGVEVFDYISLMFGNFIFHNKTSIHTENGINKDELNKFVAFLEENGYDYVLKNSMLEKTTSKDEQFLKKVGLQNAEREDLQKDIDSEQIYQVLVNGQVPDDVRKSFPYFNFFYMPDDYTDVTKHGLTKGTQIDILSRMYPKHEMVAIGDSFNDVDMFKHAKISVAMGNACDEVKRQATFVTKSLDEDGLLYAFDNILRL